MTKFRKKPVVIEAFQMTQERRMDNSEWPEWLNAAWNTRAWQETALRTLSRLSDEMGEEL